VQFKSSNVLNRRLKGSKYPPHWHGQKHQNHMQRPIFECWNISMSLEIWYTETSGKK